MKVSQLFKVSAVVLALGVVPMHAAFAHEGCQSDQKSEQAESNQEATENNAG